MGVGGEALGECVFATRTFQRMHGQDRGPTGIDDDFFARRFLNVGAWIFGRNMFGPVRGPWPDNSWKGAWGDTPPFRNPVFAAERFIGDIDLVKLGYTCTEHVAGECATHVALGCHATY
jgi:hypothetical protein